jgi:hypothetical protein
VELSIGDEWVNATELWQGMWRPGSDGPVAGGFPLPGMGGGWQQTGPVIDPMGPQDPSEDQGTTKDQPAGKDQPAANGGDQPAAPPKPEGDDEPLV